MSLSHGCSLVCHFSAVHVACGCLHVGHVRRRPIHVPFPVGLLLVQLQQPTLRRQMGRRKRLFLYKCSSKLQSQRDLISWIQLSGPHDFLPSFRALQSVLCLQRFLFLSLRIQQCSCPFKSETHPFQSSRPFRYSSFLINFSFFFFLN